MIYDFDWVDMESAVTVGRKGELCFWRVSVAGLESGSVQYRHKVTGSVQDDYRCVEVLNPMSKLLVASLESKVLLFDSSTAAPVYTFDYRQCSQIRCCKWSTDQNVCVIGGANSIGALDPRQQNIPFLVNFTEHRCVRTLSTQGHRITFGTASGKLAFVDVRMPKLLSLGTLFPTSPTPSNLASNSSIPTFSSPITPLSWIVKNHDYFQVIGGRLLENDFYAENFAPHRVEQAIFTHAYDPSGLRLFIGGGPSLESLQGCTAGILF